MQAQFEEQFGSIEGTDIETTQRLIEANNKVIQKQSEEFFEKKFKELSTSLSKEIQKSNDLILHKFAAMNAQQNTTLLSFQEAIMACGDASNFSFIYLFIFPRGNETRIIKSLC